MHKEKFHYLYWSRNLFCWWNQEGWGGAGRVEGMGEGKYCNLLLWTAEVKRYLGKSRRKCNGEYQIYL